MRVSAISSAYYAPKMRNNTIQNKRTNYLSDCCEPQQANSPAFKGFIKSMIGTVGGGMLGFILGGPVVCVAAAALSGIIGGVQDEDDGTNNDSDELPYDFYSASYYNN